MQVARAQAPVGTTPEPHLRPVEDRGGPPGGFMTFDPAQALERERQERRRLLWSLALATVLHGAFFFLVLPERQQEPLTVRPREQKVYVIEQVRFEPPKAQPQQRIPKQQTRKIPIPDPTPDEPEPIRVADLPEPDFDALDPAEGVLDIPPGPPDDNIGPRGILQVTAGVLAPQKIYAPDPTYTEEARTARVQGVVIVQAVIDTAGEVARLQVLKGLPHGMTEAAVETVKQWKFKPATLDGEPVSVYYNLTITFTLQ